MVRQAQSQTLILSIRWQAINTVGSWHALGFGTRWDNRVYLNEAAENQKSRSEERPWTFVSSIGTKLECVLSAVTVVSPHGMCLCVVAKEEA